MKVRISVRHDGMDVGDVVEVSRSDGSRMVHEGYAVPYGAEQNRKDVPGPLAASTMVGGVTEGVVDEPQAPSVAELRKLAKDRGITVREARDAWALERGGAPSSTVIPPTTESDEKEH